MNTSQNNTRPTPTSHEHKGVQTAQYNLRSD